MNPSVISPLARRGGFLFRLLTWVLIAVAACFSLLLLSLRYWLLPDIEQYRENIASAISQASGQHITIGEITANWDGFRPHMMLGAVKIHDREGDITLLLHRLEGTVSWRSVLHGELLFREVAIEQPDLIVRRDAAGMIHVAGFALNKELTASEDGFSDWLLNQRRVTINNASILWQDDQRGAAELELLVNLRLENRGDRHRFGMRATPPAELAAQLDMRGDFTGGSLINSELWRGRLFMQINRADIAAWRIWLPFPPEIKLNRGIGALRLWAGINGADMTKLTVDMRLHDVQAQLAPDLPELNLVRLQGRVGWKKINDGTKKGAEFFAQKLRTSIHGSRERELQPVSFLLQTIPAYGEKSGSGKLIIDDSRLEILGSLAQYLPIDASLREQLGRTSPRGDIHYLRAQWNGELPRPSYFSTKGSFTNLGLRLERLPAFSGITGNIDITERGGTLNLNSQNAVLELPDVFREPLALDTFTGQADWKILPDKDSIAFTFNNISFSNTHAAGLAYGNYRTTPDGPGIIDLTGHVTRADARYLLDYMPMGVDRHSRDRLEESIVEGRFFDTRLHLKGDLGRFPFGGDDNGVFKMHAKASGVTLDNITGWPRIENMSGDLHFHGSRMEFDASQADIFGTTLSKAKLRIADMTAADAMLRSEIEANGPTRQFLKFAAASTADSYDNRLVDKIGITGNGRLLLKLDIPLHRPEAASLAGNYQFTDNQIDASPNIPNLHSINGVMTFTRAGIKVENITARLLGGPVLISSTDKPDGSMELSAIGRINLDNLYQPPQERVTGPAPLWVRHLHGSTDWRANLHMRDKLVNVSIESSLHGIMSDLPAPLSKTASDAVPLRFERKASGQDLDELNLSVGSQVTATIERIRDGTGEYHAERGTVNFGPTPVVLSENSGISVTGAVPLLNLDRWRRLLKEFNNEPGPSFGLTGINLHIGALDFLGRRLNDVTLKADKEDMFWYSTIASNEINGGVTWDPSGNGKIVARLNRLIVPAASPRPDPGVTAQAQQLKNLPALDVTADHFLVDEIQLGKLELIADQHGRNWQIEKLHITNPDSSIMIRGVWRNRTVPPRVEATLTLQADDIGKFLTRLGHPDRVKRGSGSLEGMLSWHGGPQSIDYATLSGNFKLNARRGQFPKFEPGIGRLFGIFSLRALPRRITLDFHDVFSEGFGFDDISGDVKITRGVAFTEDLRIEGPAAKVIMNGEMNLEAETQKLHIRVTPSFGLATPVVGMATVIASTALQNPTTSNEYNITGTWADPVVTKIPRHAHESIEHAP
ncbi:YhdP family protein [Nitrosovibrio sp. Nv6]|uniref:YhdP family protein n=1 Tax=Nitrosovibrio sp. Nv6 TaxID=1855340 RepID=UPI0008D13373|nr:YhdP family protein [Nitrosovibrio sp. Nv6]SEP16057.1 TIGR02099 family protein [Nitrosovibrio sp. Nv6]